MSTCGDEKLAPQRQNEKYQSMKRTFFALQFSCSEKILLYDGFIMVLNYLFME